MANTLTSIRLSETQKTLLCQIVAAPTEELAYEASEDGTNIVAARDQLTQLGLMTWEEGTAEVTEQGLEVMRDEALIDEGGQLTEEGSKYAYGEDGDQEQQQQQQGEEDPLGMNDMMGDESGGSGAPNPQEPDPMQDAGSGEMDMADAQMSSFDLLRTMNNAHIIAEQVLKIKRS